jgi:hypothetical protein
MDTTIAEETAANTMAQRDNHEIAHAVSSAKGLLAQGHGMGIVGQGNSDTQTVAQHGGKGYDALPRHVGSILHTVCQIIAAGRADAYRMNALKAPMGIDQVLDVLTEHGQIVTYIRMFRGYEAVRRDNFSPNINYAN